MRTQAYNGKVYLIDPNGTSKGCGGCKLFKECEKMSIDSPCELMYLNNNEVPVKIVNE